MSTLRRRIIVEVEDRQFQQHRRTLGEYLSRTPREFDRAGRAANDYGRAVGSTVAGTQRAARSAGDLVAAQARLRLELKGVETALRDAQRAYLQADRSKSKFREEAKANVIALEQERAALRGQITELGKSERAMRRGGTEARRMRAETDGLGGSFERVGQRAARWLQRIAVGAVLALGAALLKATAQAATFRAGMAQVATLMGVSAAETRGYEEQLIGMATRTGVPLAELTESFYQVVSAGFEGADAIRILDQSARAAVAGNVDLKTSVEGVTTALNAWGGGAAGAEDTTDSLFVAVRRGVTTLGELSGSLGTVAPLAAQAEIEVSELLAAVSALTLSGASTSLSMTGLRNILQSIIKPSAAAQKEAERLGLQFDLAALKAKGLQGFLNDVATATDGSTESMAQLFEGSRSLVPVLALTGNQADTFASILSDMETRAGTTTQAFKTMSAETTTLWARVKNNLSATFLDLGTRVLPLVNDQLRRMLNLLDSWRSPHEQQIDFLRRIGAPTEQIVAIQVRIDQERLNEEIEFARSRLEDLASTVGNPFDRAGFEVSEFLSEPIDLATASAKEMGAALEEATRVHGDLLKKAREEGAGFFDRATLARAQSAVQNLEEAIGHRERLSILESRSEEDLRAAAEAALAMGDAVGAAADELDEIEEIEPLTDEQRKAAEKLAEAMRSVGEAAKLAAASTDGVRKALGELFTKQKELRELNAQAAALEQQFGEQGAAIVAQRREQIEKEIESLQGRVAREEELKAAIDRTAASLNEYIDNVDLAGLFGDGEVRAEMLLRRLGQVNDAAKTYAETLTEISVEERSGALSAEDAADRRTRASNEYEAALRAIYEELKRLGLDSPAMLKALEEAWGKVKDETEEADDKAKDYAKGLQSIAAGARGILRLGDAFGDLNDDVRETLESVVDLADGLAGIVANPADIGSWVQAVGGFVGTLSGLFGGDPTAAQLEALEATRRAMEEMKALQQSVRDNIRALDRNTRAALDAAQPGSSVDPQTQTAAETLLLGLFGELRDLLGAGHELDPVAPQIMDRIRRLFEDLEGLGIPGLGDNLDETFQSIVDAFLAANPGASMAEAMRAALDAFLYGDFSALPDEMIALLTDMFGESFSGLDAFLQQLFSADYADTIEGQIERIRDMMRYLGLTGEEALSAFVENLLANVDELSAEAQALLAEIAALDLSTEEGQAAFQDLIAQLYGLGSASGLSQDALEQMLDALLGFAGGVEQAAEEIAEATTIADAIRAVQRALRFGAMSVDEAMAAFLASIRDMEFDAPVFGDMEGNTALSSFLDQIAGLNLHTEAGQEALADIIREMFLLGAGAFGLEEGAFDALLAQLQALGAAIAGGPMLGVDPNAPTAPVGISAGDAIREAVRQIERALRFGGMSIEDAMAAFIASLRDLDLGDVLGDAEGNTILDAFLDQIEGLDLGTEAGQQALQDIVAQMFDLGAGAFGLTEEAFDALLAQLLALGNAFETAAEALDPDPVRDAIDYIRLALRFGAIELEDALALLLAAIRDAATGPMLGDIEGNTALDQFLDQIAGLDLSSEEGQEALAEIIRQMFLLGAGAFGLDEATFQAMLEELQSLGNQFGTAADPSGSAAFRVARTITEFQANVIIDVLRAILHAIRGEGMPPTTPGGGTSSPGPVAHTPPIIVLPPSPSAFMPNAPMVPLQMPARGQAGRSAAQVDGYIGPFYVSEVDYPHIRRTLLKDMGRDIRRHFGHQ